jgi:hypothetical protein
MKSTEPVRPGIGGSGAYQMNGRAERSACVGSGVAVGALVVAVGALVVAAVDALLAVEVGRSVGRPDVGAGGDGVALGAAQAMTTMSANARLAGRLGMR